MFFFYFSFFVKKTGAVYALFTKLLRVRKVEPSHDKRNKTSSRVRTVYNAFVKIYAFV